MNYFYDEPVGSCISMQRTLIKLNKNIFLIPGQTLNTSIHILIFFTMTETSRKVSTVIVSYGYIIHVKFENIYGKTENKSIKVFEC